MSGRRPRPRRLQHRGRDTVPLRVDRPDDHPLTQVLHRHRAAGVPISVPAARQMGQVRKAVSEVSSRIVPSVLITPETRRPSVSVPIAMVYV